MIFITYTAGRRGASRQFEQTQCTPLRSDSFIHQQVAVTMIKTLICLLSLTSLSASAFTALQCGPFDLKADPKGTVTVNGINAKIKSTTFIKAKDDYDNVKLHWRVKNAKTPGSGSS
ncbi:hypothetical protein FD733_01710 [Pantoea sp. Eser]|nr:hypothetical protein [Pantoea sp. Eser]